MAWTAAALLCRPSRLIVGLRIVAIERPAMPPSTFEEIGVELDSLSYPDAMEELTDTRWDVLRQRRPERENRVADPLSKVSQLRSWRAGGAGYYALAIDL